MKDAEMSVKSRCWYYSKCHWQIFPSIAKLSIFSHRRTCDGLGLPCERSKTNECRGPKPFQDRPPDLVISSSKARKKKRNVLKSGFSWKPLQPVHIATEPGLSESSAEDFIVTLTRNQTPSKSSTKNSSNPRVKPRSTMKLRTSSHQLNLNKLKKLIYHIWNSNSPAFFVQVLRKKSYLFHVGLHHIR